MSDDKTTEPAPAWGQVTVLIDPAVIPQVDERALSDETFDLVQQLLTNRGITYDFDPGSDSEVNASYLEAMDALHSSIVETAEHSMYVRHLALGLLSRIFHSGELHAMFESNDPSEFSEHAVKVANHITKSLSIAVAGTAAALVVFPNDDEYMSDENAVRRLVNFGVKFFNDEDANIATIAVRSVEDMDTDEDWDEFFWGEPNDD